MGMGMVPSMGMGMMNMPISRNLVPAMNTTREIVREFAPILRADIIESLNDYHVHLDLPGVHANDLDVTIANGFLTIKAERKQVHEEDNDFTHRVERSYGKVQRSVAIPLNADAENAQARFENGVLTVKFNKRQVGVAGRKLAIL